MNRKKIFVYGGVALTVLVVTVLVVSDGDGESSFDTIIAERGDLVQEVSVTGRVVAAESADLAFEKGGRINFVSVKVGDNVSASQTLVQLESDEILAQIRQAEASLKIEKAKLDELVRGSRPEEIDIQRVKVTNAKVVVSESKKNLVDVIQDAFTKSDDAVHAKVDQIFTQTFQGIYEVGFVIPNTQLETLIENGRSSVEATFSGWQAELVGLSTLSNLRSFTSTAKTNLNEIKSFLNNTALAVNALTANSTLSQTTVDGYKADVSTARTNVNTAITNLSTADEELQNAESALKLVEQELVLKEVGASLEELAAQEAKVEEASANVLNRNAQFLKTVLKAPFAGLITFQEAKVGEIAPANEVLVSLISPDLFEIEAFVPEADIAKIEVGDSSKVTLDAYSSDDIFYAEVIAINPAETIIEGVATYKTTLLFSVEDERIKSGMTANIDVLTDERTDIITVPVRAVISVDNKKIVRHLQDGILVEVFVEVGVRGSDGSIEIISGVEVGDEVIVFINE